MRAPLFNHGQILAHGFHTVNTTFIRNGILLQGNLFCFIVKTGPAITPAAWNEGVEMRQVDVLATVLLVVGAINWGLVGFARFDLVATLFGMQFGDTSPLTSLIYGLVGLAGVYRTVAWKGVSSHEAPLATR
jgi:uncharacterized protein